MKFIVYCFSSLSTIIILIFDIKAKETVTYHKTSENWKYHVLNPLNFYGVAEKFAANNFTAENFAAGKFAGRKIHRQYISRLTAFVALLKLTRYIIDSGLFHSYHPTIQIRLTLINAILYSK